jgi:hypothetical protein
VLRRSTGSAPFAGPAAVALVVAATCLGLTMVPGAGAAGRPHVPHFDLLVRPTLISKLPEALRIGFEGFGKHRNEHGRKVRVGRVQLSEGTLTAVGNHRWICTNYTAKGEPPLFGGGGCAPYGQAVEEGILDICDEGGGLRIDGLVPNGVATIEFDRVGPGPTRTVPVVRNGFTARLPRADITFRALDAGSEAVIEHSFPLGHLIHGGGGPGCYTFFEARAEAPPG